MSTWRVIAYYWTGDSFRTERGRQEEVGHYLDKSIAEENIKRIQDHYDGIGPGSGAVPFEDKYSVKLLNSKREEYKIHCPWMGYFNGLERVELVEEKGPI